MQEHHLENMLHRHPDLIEPGLTFIDRQRTVNRKRIDLLFRDSAGCTLVVEVKIGAIGRVDIGQLSEYCHYLYEQEGIRPRGMLIGTSVPNEVRGAAGFNGFECTGLTLAYLEQFMTERGDHEMLGHLGLGAPFDEPLAPPPLIEIAPRLPRAEKLASSVKTNFSISDMLRSLLAGIPPGTMLKRHNLVSAILEANPDGVTRDGILLSDKCYNTTNAGLGANYEFRIFEHAGPGNYRYFGEGYPYSGYVTWKGVRCGLWTKGVLSKWENWPMLASKSNRST
jgi:hypothetical protein